jgi:hypothetical protein
MNIIQALNENNFNGISDALEIRQYFFDDKISVSYEKDLVNGRRRFIFTTLKSVRNKTFNVLNVEANGLILEAPDWNVCYVPPFFPKSYFDKHTTNALLKNNIYDIYYMEDGTVVGLYYYANLEKWVISSSRGIDVNLNIFNELAYEVMLDESLSAMGINYDEFFAGLDKDKSYTIGFKHPDMHPFQEGKGEPIYKVWFIQSAVNAIGSEFKVVKTSPWEKIPGHKKLTFKINSLDPLFNKIHCTFEEFKADGRVNYGFILSARTSNPKKYGENSVLMIESKLLNFIRNMWYYASYHKFSNANSYSLQNVILLNSFLNSTHLSTFETLFPQFKDHFLNLQIIENELIEKLYINVLHSLTNNTTSITNVENEEESDVEDDIINILSTQVLRVTQNITAHEKPKQFIKDIIHINNNIDIYYKYIQHHNMVKNTKINSICGSCDNIDSLNESLKLVNLGDELVEKLSKVTISPNVDIIETTD